MRHLRNKENTQIKIAKLKMLDQRQPENHTTRPMIFTSSIRRW
jgi:hypothetical protein